VLRAAANIGLWVGVRASALAAIRKSGGSGPWRQGWRAGFRPGSLAFFFAFEGRLGAFQGGQPCRRRCLGVPAVEFLPDPPSCCLGDASRYFRLPRHMGALPVGVAALPRSVLASLMIPGPCSACWRHGRSEAGPNASWNGSDSLVAHASVGLGAWDVKWPWAVPSARVWLTNTHRTPCSALRAALPLQLAGLGGREGWPPGFQQCTGFVRQVALLLPVPWGRELG